MKNGILVRGLLLATLFALVACGQPTAPADEGVVFYRGNGAEPETLDPNHVQTSYENSVVSDMLIGLMTEDADGESIPGAATSWETSEDGLTWTFHLREHQWSDGTPVTAHDFIYSWQRLLAPETAATYAYFIFIIKNAEAINAGDMDPSMLGARAVDDHTLVIELEHPVPYLLEMLPHNTMLPIPSHVVEEHGNAWTRPGNYVGNGPYTLVEWVPNGHITLVKNPLFYDAENVSIDRVVFYPTQDYDAALRRFRAGELDVQVRSPAASFDFIRQNMAENLNQAPQLTVEFIAMNQSVPPLDDVRVRRALNLALNREIITDTVRRVGETPAYSMVPPGIANYTHEPEFDFKDTPYPERIAEAQALMQEAGFGPNNRLSVELAIRSTSADARRVPAAIQEMWREIYVNLEIAQMDTAIFYSRMDEHDFELGQAAWGADFNDAINFLDLLRTGNGQNYGLYSNPDYDALLDQALNESDVEARAELLARAEMIALQDAAWIPILFWANTNLVHTYVSGWHANPQDHHRTRWVTIDTEARAAMFPDRY